MMPYTIKKQTGAALIISLILLLAMTIISVTSMKGTTTELAMAGNLRESAITFQAAEVGLKTAEALLDIENEPGNVIDKDAIDPDYLDDNTWTSSAATTVSVSLPNISNNPQFIIKNLGQWDPDKKVSVEITGYDEQSPAPKVDYFRSTARGYGVTGNTYRTVQSFYGRPAK
jgi:type IV pilus assembly protein PilX